MEWIWLTVSAVIFLTACGRGDTGENAMTKGSLTADQWQRIAKARILFGHQSVGANILSGIDSLAKEASVSLNMTESRNLSKDAGITHFRVGQNGDPPGKIKDFSDIVKSMAPSLPDIALMKLCYDDINSRTDVKALAKAYMESLDSLSRQFPGVHFIAVTTPLTTVQSGPKAWIKRFMGRPVGLSENYRRMEFNNILRSRYGGKGHLLDLARREAEGSDHYTYEGKPVEVLNPVFAFDDGHLNDKGGRHVADALLQCIAGCIAGKG